MAKAKIYGSYRPFVPNSSADQRKKRFKRKAKQRKGSTKTG